MHRRAPAAPCTVERQGGRDPRAATEWGQKSPHGGERIRAERAPAKGASYDLLVDHGIDHAGQKEAERRDLNEFSQKLQRFQKKCVQHHF